MKPIHILIVIIFATHSVFAGTEILGDKDAKVKMAVFGDLQCPFTKRMVDQVSRLQKEFGKDLSISFVHKPLDFHQQAKSAAIASYCAGKQELYWPFLRNVFKNQNNLSDQNIDTIARNIGVRDLGGFDLCRRSQEALKAIETEIQVSSAVGVQGTPYVFINGKLFKGAYPYEEFAKEIRRIIAL